MLSVKLPLIKKLAGFVALAALALGSLTGSALAIDHIDGGGEWESCPTPVFCSGQVATKAPQSIQKQDNGYHNMLQSYHGPAQPVINTYQANPEDPLTDPPTPAQYKTVVPPDYTGTSR